MVSPNGWGNQVSNYSSWQADEPNVIQGTVHDVIFRQDRYKVTLENGFYVYLPTAPKVGERIEVGVKVECLA